MHRPSVSASDLSLRSTHRSRSILMPVHVHYAPSDVPRTSMTRAGISSLVRTSGAHWLWIHAILIWWVTITWTATVLWITWGGLAYRKREIRKLATSLEKSRQTRRQQSVTLQVNGTTPESSARPVLAPEDETEGSKRFRTLMIENIPPDSKPTMSLKWY